MSITPWGVFWFFAGWFWLSVLVGLIFGELVRRGHVRPRP